MKFLVTLLSSLYIQGSMLAATTDEQFVYLKKPKSNIFP